MSERIKCPSCSAGLILPESARGSPTTCPRCLAEISTGEARREPDAIQAERPEQRENAITGGRYGRPDIDVRRDTKQTSCFVIGLAVIGTLGVVVTGWGTLSAAANSQLTPLVYFVVALLFLAALSTAIVFGRSEGHPKAVGFRRVAVGMLALAGVVTLVIFLLIFSFIVLIVVTCGPGVFGHYSGPSRGPL
jgi:hypothetical protein